LCILNAYNQLLISEMYSLFSRETVVLLAFWEGRKEGAELIS